MYAKNFDEKSLQCPKCEKWICFKCKDYWHGYTTSCEKNFENKFQEWAGDKNNISFCPMCRTKVERISGCNKMHCAFCDFEWCWIC